MKLQPWLGYAGTVDFSTVLFKTGMGFTCSQEHIKCGISTSSLSQWSRVEEERFRMAYGNEKGEMGGNC